MKYCPYQEIISPNEEYNEYALLCEHKSKKYQYYTDWEDHIVECLNKFQSKEALCNFKHYCIKRKRDYESGQNMEDRYLILLLTIMLTKEAEELQMFALMLLFLIVIIFSVLCGNKQATRGYFYKDIIKIIEKVENKDSYCP